MKRKWTRRRRALRMALRKTDDDLSTPLKRLHAYWDLVFVDHAIFRLLWRNFGRVSPRMFRSNQPLPYQIGWAARRGVKTIVNLRGANPSGWYFLEREACERYGIALVDYPMKSRDAPPRELVLGASELFAGIEYPALMHCKSGADRAGLMAVLYLMIHENRSFDDAARHLSLRYWHFKRSKTGVIDHFFETYLRYNEKTPIAFLDWVRNVYDPGAVKAEFRSRWTSDVLVDKVLHRE